ncbi:FK506-binding protein 15-like [Penaeus indicus]|uniref:FK506-binding protein 15-like n=1 Tax=Penaeus indicus TaxID=29960 RepID=UPI00300D3C5A
MFPAGAEDDDDDFVPSSSSRLSSLFGSSTASKSSNLKYVAPKQPRPERSDSASSGSGKNNSPSPAPQQSKTQAPAVLVAAPVHAYLFVNGVAQPQGRVMCCVLGNHAEKSFQLLLYRSKQDHLTRARIHHQFNFTVQPNNYVNFSDDQQRSWSVMIDAAPYAELVIQVGVCRALAAQTVDKTQVTQDVTVGEGPVLQEGDQSSSLIFQVEHYKWKERKSGRRNQVGPSGQVKRGIKRVGVWPSRAAEERSQIDFSS